MPSTGFTLAGTGANNADAGNDAWGSPTGITADDGAVFAFSGDHTAGQSSQYLHATNFGFAVPTTASVVGIEVRVKKRADTGSALNDHTVQLIVGGSRTGDNKASATLYPTSFTNVDYGSATVLWGLTLSAADVNGATFGVAFRSQYSAATASAHVDAIWINVHYTSRNRAFSPGIIG